ncbi:hypothetical protein M8J76_014543 [Diaphorina citri]|nr:hypothetical protein M8J75_001615 [Diaphorina citri]KAI5745827.1 hypothetical protein M8J76_014543 [Diaphorina citri]KAI5752382.1 hypothetical protein M8J77_016536 [Diaphorina citri]
MVDGDCYHMPEYAGHRNVSYVTSRVVISKNRISCRARFARHISSIPTRGFQEEIFHPSIKTKKKMEMKKCDFKGKLPEESERPSFILVSPDLSLVTWSSVKCLEGFKPEQD